MEEEQAEEPRGYSLRSRRVEFQPPRLQVRRGRREVVTQLPQTPVFLERVSDSLEYSGREHSRSVSPVQQSAYFEEQPLWPVALWSTADTEGSRQQILVSTFPLSNDLSSCATTSWSARSWDSDWSNPDNMETSTSNSIKTEKFSGEPGMLSLREFCIFYRSIVSELRFKYGDIYTPQYAFEHMSSHWN